MDLSDSKGHGRFGLIFLNSLFYCPQYLIFHVNSVTILFDYRLTFRLIFKFLGNEQYCHRGSDEIPYHCILMFVIAPFGNVHVMNWLLLAPKKPHMFGSKQANLPVPGSSEYPTLWANASLWSWKWIIQSAGMDGWSLYYSWLALEVTDDCC